MTVNRMQAGFAQWKRAGALQMCVLAGGSRRVVSFCCDEVRLVPRGEALAAAVVLPAMREGADVQLDAAVDPVFMQNLHEVQTLMNRWDERFGLVGIYDGREVAVPAPAQTRRVGLFFSGGVDSFDSLLRHRDELTDLIFVHGFDILPEDDATCRRAEEGVRRVGAAFGLRVLKIRTDIRTFLDPYAEWGERAHGAAMAATAHLLPDDFERIYIAASDSGDCSCPWGSHPELDPFWGSARLEFVHDGCDRNRTQKLHGIAMNDVALQNLRVCWKNRSEALNCGWCEKCIRTMIGLQLAGALERCCCFERPLRLWNVLTMKIKHPDVATGALDNLAALKERPQSRRFYFALSGALWISRCRERFKRWRRRRCSV